MASKAELGNRTLLVRHRAEINGVEFSEQYGNSNSTATHGQRPDILRRYPNIERLNTKVLICDAAGLSLFAVAARTKPLEFELGPAPAVIAWHANWDRWRYGSRYARSRNPNCVEG